MEDRRLVVYDLETLAGCFTYSDINVDTGVKTQFVIHKDRDEHIEFISYLQGSSLNEPIKGMIGFNNLGFDMPILTHLLTEFPKWINNAEKNFIHDLEAQDIVDILYDKAQDIIKEQDNSMFRVYIKESDLLIPQLDLYKLHHFNNKARTCNLKQLEVAMNYPNVMDMPIHHSETNISLQQIDEILEYNMNDVTATYEFYKRSLDKINLRKDLVSKYNLKCLNYPDSKIGEELVLKLYCEKTNTNIWDTKKLRTNRDNIKLKDCIFDYIKFSSKEFNKLLSDFKSKTITETKGSVSETIIFNSGKYEYGLGGIHMCTKEGVYTSTDKNIIMSLDVSSLYPSIAVINKLYPEHLGEEFCEVYEDILKQRIKAKKEGNMTLSDGFKLSLNSVYGKSNDKFSFLYDPMYTMKTTLNGQLMLTMLIERLSLESFKILMVNTDGLECIVPIDKMNIYNNICKSWEEETKLSLEYVQYSKMVIRDVNNYISISNKGKIKYKGTFVLDKEYHQDNSFKIVQIALSEYFINNIPIQQTIKNHTNIYDFCGRQKFTRDSTGETHEIIDFNKVIRPQQKNVRYYISNSGKTFIKRYKKDNSLEVINKGYQITVFNKFEESDNYNINYNFYIKECNKIIDIIENKQVDLFNLIEEVENNQ